MIYCKKCGKEIADDSEFCPHCGAAQSAQPINQVGSGKMKLHCPRCKGRTLAPIVETIGSDGAGYQVSRNIAVGSSKNYNRTYWMCQDCGNKFRNIDELEQETKRFQIFIKVFTVLAIAFILLLLAAAETIFMPFAMFALLLCISMALYMLIMAKKRQSELDYLKKNCFD